MTLSYVVLGDRCGIVSGPMTYAILLISPGSWLQAKTKHPIGVVSLVIIHVNGLDTPHHSENFIRFRQQRFELGNRQTNTQTDRQTDKRRVKHILLGEVTNRGLAPVDQRYLPRRSVVRRTHAIDWSQHEIRNCSGADCRFVITRARAHTHTHTHTPVGFTGFIHCALYGRVSPVCASV